MTHCTSLAIHHTALHRASTVLREAYDTYERTGNGVEECEVAWQSFVEARDAYTAFIEEVVEVEGVSVKTLTHRGAMLVERVREVVPYTECQGKGNRIESVFFYDKSSSPEQLYVAISLLPDTVTLLSCLDTNLTMLPKLPNGLMYLKCCDTKLTALPELPDRLTHLDCHETKLTSLPKLPDGLTKIFCSETNITTLPELPNGLTHLNCFDTKITTLPELPDKLTFLVCHSTNITSLPKLPDSLEHLDCYNTPASKNPEVIAQLEAFIKMHPGVEISY